MGKQELNYFTSKQILINQKTTDINNLVKIIQSLEHAIKIKDSKVLEIESELMISGVKYTGEEIKNFKIESIYDINVNDIIVPSYKYLTHKKTTDYDVFRKENFNIHLYKIDSLISDSYFINDREMLKKVKDNIEMLLII